MVTSRRLSYRRVSQHEVDVFHSLCLDPHVKRYLLDGLDMSRTWAVDAVRQSDRLFCGEEVGLWLVQREDTRIGFCGFHVFDELGPEPQLLYAFTGEHAGFGYATEAATAMIAETERLGWSRVVAAVDRPNGASVRVIEKVGFVGCGRVPGVLGDTLLFERFREQRPTRVSAAPGTRWVLPIQQTWDGVTLGPDEVVQVELELGDLELTLRVDAPFHNDAPPDSADLWRHEVVEVMLVGTDDIYLEVELSPHSRHLVLFLHGVRTVTHRDVVLDYRAEIAGNRWRGVARIPMGWVPVATRRINAFAMHGTGPRRRYLAWKPTLGPQPDFHRLGEFGSLDDADIMRGARPLG